MQGVDHNGDGHVDIVMSNTYNRAFLLLNDCSSREEPRFTQTDHIRFENTSHAMYGGGGDWNDDGVRDYLHMPYGGGQYKVLAGDPLLGKGLKFPSGSARGAPRGGIDGDRARSCAWAWDYSGTARERRVIEYVGVKGESSGIHFFEVAAGTSRCLGTVATFAGRMPQLTACDVNADGRMDVIYSGGVDRGDAKNTRVFVLYGKIDNVPAEREWHRGTRDRRIGHTQ